MKTQYLISITYPDNPYIYEHMDKEAELLAGKYDSKIVDTYKRKDFNVRVHDIAFNEMTDMYSFVEQVRAEKVFTLGFDLSEEFHDVD